VAGPNLAPGLIDGLSAIYGVAVTAESVFDTILCLLSADGYTTRFAEDLEDVFPHVPFPADHGVFLRAAELGGRIREIETFAQAPEALADSAFVRLDTPPTSDAECRPGEPDGTRLVLCADGSGEVTGLPEALWSFEVSGYPVLRRWIGAREGLPLDHDLFLAFRDVCGRIADLVDLFARADTILT